MIRPPSEAALMASPLPPAPKLAESVPSMAPPRRRFLLFDKTGLHPRGAFRGRPHVLIVRHSRRGEVVAEVALVAHLFHVVVVHGGRGWWGPFFRVLSVARGRVHLVEHVGERGRGLQVVRELVFVGRLFVLVVAELHVDALHVVLQFLRGVVARFLFRERLGGRRRRGRQAQVVQAEA